MEDEKIDKILLGLDLEKDTDLNSDLVDELIIIKEGIRLSTLESKLDLLKNIESEITKKENTTLNKESANSTKELSLADWLKRNNRFVSIAAGLVILAVFITVFHFNNQGYTGVYNDYFENYPAMHTSRSESNESEFLANAMAEYNAGNYKLAEALLSELDVPSAKFYRAISLMYIHRYDKAVTILNDFQNNNEANNYPVHYYKALCYIKLEEKEKAIHELNLVSEVERPYYYTKSQEILNKL